MIGFDLPHCLEGQDFRLYTGSGALESTYDGWTRMWWDIAYVRMQGLDRDADALEAARDWEDI